MILGDSKDNDEEAAEKKEASSNAGGANGKPEPESYQQKSASALEELWQTLTVMVSKK